MSKTINIKNTIDLLQIEIELVKREAYQKGYRKGISDAIMAQEVKDLNEPYPTEPEAVYEPLTKEELKHFKHITRKSHKKFKWKKYPQALESLLDLVRRGMTITEIAAISKGRITKYAIRSKLYKLGYKIKDDKAYLPSGTK